MRVLVTGAAGFLGSHLSLYHLHRGDEVVGVDDFSSSAHESRHMHLLEDHGSFEFVQMDISHIDFPGRLMWNCRGKFDVIYNFACPASPPIYQDQSFHTLDTCFNGTKNVLQLASVHGATLVHASTSEVYGDPSVSPQPESYRGYVNSFGPRACYDEGKRVAEALCWEELHQHGTDVRLVRIFNTYGPHMDPWDGRVVTNFIRQALRGEDITVYGNGDQTRSFCYVDDLIRGITSLAMRPETPDIAGELHRPINLGTPVEFPVIVLAELVIDVTRSQSRIVHRDLPIDDPLQRRPDITRARELLGWEPRVPLTQGVEMTAAYFRDTLDL